MYCIGKIKQLKYGYFGIHASIHYPSPMFISLSFASGNKHGLGAMETAYIPHNHTLTVYCYLLNVLWLQPTTSCCLHYEHIIYYEHFPFSSENKVQ